MKNDTKLKQAVRAVLIAAAVFMLFYIMFNILGYVAKNYMQPPEQNVEQQN